MRNFGFSFTKTTTKSSSKPKETSIHKNIIGVVGIGLDANWYVKVNDTKYPIKQSCYSCKDIEFVYSIRKYTKHNFVKIGRLLGDRCGLSNDHYLPFHVGIAVEGNIIIPVIGAKPVFDIKSYEGFELEPNVAEDMINEKVFWRENYKEIENVRTNKIIIE